MKFLSLVLITFFSFSSAAFAEENIDTLVVKTNIFCDHCMQCGSCKPKIETALLYTAGVQSMVLDPEAMTINVVYRSNKITPEKIRTVISKTGYDADDVKADPKAYSRLDGCCKK